LEINILSLCDGMSCGQIALNKANIKYNKYFASEIDSESIKITQKNFPNTIQVGDLLNIDFDYLKTLPKIDLVIFGFPCRNASKAVKGRDGYDNGLQGKSTWLFFPCADILHWIQKNNNTDVYFLCENVDGMSKQDQETINNSLNVEPILINSNIFSAQDRKRLYWTNIPMKELPNNKGLILQDIMQNSSEIEEKYWYKQSFDFHGFDKKVCATLNLNGHDILKRVNNPDFTSPTLTSCRGGNLQKKVFQDGKCRKLTPIEYERLQTVPENYTEGVSMTSRYNMLGDGWTVDAIAYILSYLSE